MDNPDARIGFARLDPPQPCGFCHGTHDTLTARYNATVCLPAFFTAAMPVPTGYEAVLPDRPMQCMIATRDEFTFGIVYPFQPQAGPAAAMVEPDPLPEAVPDPNPDPVRDFDFPSIRKASPGLAAEVDKLIRGMDADLERMERERRGRVVIAATPAIEQKLADLVDATGRPRHEVEAAIEHFSRHSAFGLQAAVLHCAMHPGILDDHWPEIAAGEPDRPGAYREMGIPKDRRSRR